MKTKTRRLPTAIAILVLTGLIPPFHNCSKTPLMRDLTLNPGALGGDLCTQKASDIRSNLKFLFIIDRSGSNQKRFTTTTPAVELPGTDIDGSLRFDPLMDFVDSYRTDTSVYWGMINFSTNASSVTDNTFTNDASAFYDEVADQKADTQEIDQGWTDYLKALTLADTMIKADIEEASEQFPIVASTYVVFFISDGAPIVDGNVILDQDEINASIEGTLALKKQYPTLVEGIQVNTGYYYSDLNPDTEARTRLDQMSKKGLGEFLEFGAGARIDFSQYSALSRKQKFDVKEIWFVNKSVIWNGMSLMIDDDSDSVPDDLEPSYGASATKYDSDSNGVGDGVEMRISANQRPCKDMNCAAAGAARFGACLSIQKDPATGTFVDRDKDGLNDCEEALLSSDPINFDTNGDYLPDDLAFRYGLSTLAGAQDLYLDPDQDGMSNYAEIKAGTPLRVMNSSIAGLLRAGVTIRKTMETDDQACYAMSAGDIPMLGKGNKLAVYFIQNTNIVNENRIMRKAEVRASGGSVYFRDSDFR
ncbi:MAG: hypothetical protein AB7G93_16885 [Bdellovibrionales bacterium]